MNTPDDIGLTIIGVDFAEQERVDLAEQERRTLAYYELKMRLEANEIFLVPPAPDYMTHSTWPHDSPPPIAILAGDDDLENNWDKT